jgi:recombination protein RecA
MPTAAEKAREKLMAQFAESYGKGSMSVREKNTYDAISTGSIALDRAMSGGGYLLGRCTEVWGAPAGGKSSLVQIAMANAQKKFPDKLAAMIDAEHTFDPAWAKTLGADPSRILYIDPLTAENVADMTKDAIRSDILSMLVIDSAGALLTNNEFEKAAGESDMGKRAQVVTRMVNIATGLATRHNIAVIIVNQARANFGYGADTKPSGPFALSHSMTQRLAVKRASSPYTIGSKETQVNVGYEMGVKVERNKIGPEGRNVKFDFYTVAHSKKGVHFPVGIDKVVEAFALGTRDGYISQTGSYYTFSDGDKVQGQDAAKDKLRNNPGLVQEIRDKILAEAATEVHMDDLPTLTLEQTKELVS